MKILVSNDGENWQIRELVSFDKEKALVRHIGFGNGQKHEIQNHVLVEFPYWRKYEEDVLCDPGKQGD